MSSISESVLPGRRIAAWLCLCPLLAIAVSWQISLVLAIGLLVCIVATASALGALHSVARRALRLPLAALIAGTLAVLEQLALAAWWPALDAAIAPWLVLVAGLAVLVCCAPSNDASRNDAREHAVDFDIAYTLKLGAMLSVALLLIGVARDFLGHAFLLSNTPIGALVLLALLLAIVNAVTRPSGTLSPRAGRGDKHAQSHGA